MARQSQINPNVPAVGKNLISDDVRANFTAAYQDVNNLYSSIDNGVPLGALSIGTVTSGTTASATVTGTPPNQSLNLVLPVGPAGQAPNLTIGTVTSGATTSATITGTAPNLVLNLVSQKGDTGPPGAASTVPGPPGVSVILDGTVATSSALPAANTVTATHGYITSDTNHVWQSNGTSWTDLGVQALTNQASTKLDALAGPDVQTIGRSGTPVNGDGNLLGPGLTFIFATPVQGSGALQAVRAYLNAGVTQFAIKLFRPDPSGGMTQVGSDIVLTPSGGANTWSVARGDFTAVPVRKGDVLGWYLGGGGALSATASVAPPDALLYASGNVSSGVNTGINSVQAQIGFDIARSDALKLVDITAPLNRLANELSNIAQQRVQTVGTPGTLVLGAGALSDVPIVIATSTICDGQITAIRFYSSGAGPVEVRLYDLISGVYVSTQAPLVLSGASGTNSFSSANGDFAAINVKPGQFIGVYSGGRITYTGTSALTVAYSITGTRALIPETPHTIDLQAAFDVTYQNVIAVKFIGLTQAAYDALAVKDPGTLYGITA